MKFIFVLIAFVLSSSTVDLTAIRTHFKVANQSKEKASAFYKLFTDETTSTALTEAYRGAAITLKAKYSSDLLHKKKYATTGLTLLEKSVAKDPNNVEIRLIRLSIQENAPKILRYNSNIKEDKEWIVQGYKKESKAVQELIKDYSQHSKVFTELEKRNF